MCPEGVCACVEALLGVEESGDRVGVVRAAGAGQSARRWGRVMDVGRGGESAGLALREATERCARRQPSEAGLWYELLYVSAPLFVPLLHALLQLLQLLQLHVYDSCCECG